MVFRIRSPSSLPVLYSAKIAKDGGGVQKRWERGGGAVYWGLGCKIMIPFSSTRYSISAVKAHRNSQRAVQGTQELTGNMKHVTPVLHAVALLASASANTVGYNIELLVHRYCPPLTNHMHLKDYYLAQKRRKEGRAASNNKTKTHCVTFSTRYKLTGNMKHVTPACS